MKNIKYAVLGILFGIILVKSEVISWFRIQEMFRFQSIHMYGVIGSAVLTGMISIGLIKKFRIKTIQRETVTIAEKKFTWGNVFGGLIFFLLLWTFVQAALCSDRQRLWRGGRYARQRDRRHLAVRVDSG